MGSIFIFHFFNIFVFILSIYMCVAFKIIQTHINPQKVEQIMVRMGHATRLYYRKWSPDLGFSIYYAFTHIRMI